MYHNVLPRGVGVCNSQTNPHQQHAIKGIKIEKLSHTQKDAPPQTDAISNKSNKTIWSIKEINFIETIPPGTCLNPKKMGYALV